MKTVKQWLEDLQEPYRSAALKNMWWEDADTPEPNLPRALHQAFNWSRSPEGYKYWKKVHDEILDQLLTFTFTIYFQEEPEPEAWQVFDFF